MLAGSCGFVCQSSYSCVSSICTNTNFGKKLLGEGADSSAQPAGGVGPSLEEH